MRKVIFFDVDGVLLDMMGPFCEQFMAPMKVTDLETYGCHIYPPYNGDIQQMANDFKTFIESPAYGDLSPLCIMTSLEALVAMGYELQVITQSSGSTNARANRVWNLVKKFGPVFSGVHFTVFKQSKLEYINEWSHTNLTGADKVYALVEDKPETVTETFDFSTRKTTKQGALVSTHVRGLKAIGIKQTYNKASWDNPGELWFPGVDSFAFSLVHNTIENQVQTYGTV